MAVINRSTEEVVEVEVYIEASAETVFSFFAEPDRMMRWMGSRVDLDATPGGRYRVAIREGVTAIGSYVEVTPPHKVSFTWGWEGSDSVPPGASTVEVELSPSGQGTLVRLRHFDLPREEHEMHLGGWQHYMSRL
ncbi:MAG: SRPBCC family protein, partial [Dehalococcoidia bacterium]